MTENVSGKVFFETIKKHKFPIEATTFCKILIIRSSSHKFTFGKLYLRFLNIFSLKFWCFLSFQP